ncbi:hypothetical protein QFZ75_008133 [Streptomyces sp. V3I8]|nr:hypothetical protein [Streptomyces sp. V3I8]
MNSDSLTSAEAVTVHYHATEGRSWLLAPDGTGAWPAPLTDDAASPSASAWTLSGREAVPVCDGDRVRQVWERAKETRKPLTVISPMARWASSNASGIIVSATIARIAPAATAVTAAITAGEKPPTTV